MFGTGKTEICRSDAAAFCRVAAVYEKIRTLCFVIPYVLVNLMSDYTYQHDIFFQYTYGSTAFLFYLSVINYEDIAIHAPAAHKYTPLIFLQQCRTVLYHFYRTDSNPVSKTLYSKQSIL